MQEEMRTPDEQTQNTNATKKLQRNTHTNRQKNKAKNKASLLWLTTRG